MGEHAGLAGVLVGRHQQVGRGQAGQELLWREDLADEAHAVGPPGAPHHPRQAIVVRLLLGHADASHRRQQGARVAQTRVDAIPARHQVFMPLVVGEEPVEHDHGTVVEPKLLAPQAAQLGDALRGQLVRAVLDIAHVVRDVADVLLEALDLVGGMSHRDGGERDKLGVVAAMLGPHAADQGMVGDHYRQLALAQPAHQLDDALAILVDVHLVEAELMLQVHHVRAHLLGDVAGRLLGPARIVDIYDGMHPGMGRRTPPISVGDHVVGVPQPGDGVALFREVGRNPARPRRPTGYPADLHVFPCSRCSGSLSRAPWARLFGRLRVTPASDGEGHPERSRGATCRPAYILPTRVLTQARARGPGGTRGPGGG